MKHFAGWICILLLLSISVFAAAETVDGPLYKTIPGEGPAFSFSEDDGISGDDAFDGFILRSFGIGDAYTDPGLLTAAQHTQGSKLRRLNAKIYTRLAALISEVANGNRSSTSFEIPIADLIGKTSFTAAELGVDRLYDSEYVESENTVYITPTEQAMDALFAKIDFNFDLVILSLKFDLPYELYWYGNAGGWTGPGCDLNRDFTELRFTSDYIRIDMYVAAEYSSENREGTTSFNTAIARSVRRAAQNAQNIIAENRSKPDYEKLRAYRDAICDLVDYNWPAAERIVSFSAPYGNPSQLVWVFDGDDSTKVVCEGYAKAFKYLCDETTFDSYVSVAMVAGVMGSEGDFGGHMWNVVTMNDSRHYLVDVTNCDSDNGDYSDELFMVGYTSRYRGANGETGYTYTVYGGGLTYIPNDDQIEMYSAEELSMSDSAYEVIKIRAEWPITIPIGSSWYPAFWWWNTVDPCTWTMQVVHKGEVLAYYDAEREIDDFTFDEAGEYDLICSVEDGLGRVATRTAKATAMKPGALRPGSFTVETIQENGENSHDVWLKLTYSGGFHAVSFHYQIFAKDSNDQWFMTWEEDSHLAEPHFWLGEDGEHYLKAQIIDGNRTYELSSEVFYVGHKPTLIESFVTRCYKVILGRAPDADGLKYWADSLEEGEKAASNIIDGFVNSQEFLNRHYGNDEAVEILYLAMLNRAPDAGGKAYWVNMLNIGNPFSTVINGFCGSQEFRQLCDQYGISPGSVSAAPVGKRTKIEAFVRRCYLTILSREPDAGGLNNWSNALESGAQAAASIINGFVNSQEFLNKHLSNAEAVEILYLTMLNRPSDPAGKADWVNKLNQGQPFAAVINGFCGSQEFTSLCNDYGIVAGSVPLAHLPLSGHFLPDGTPDSEPEEPAAGEADAATAPEDADHAENGDANIPDSFEAEAEEADDRVLSSAEELNAAVSAEDASDASGEDADATEQGDAAAEETETTDPAGKAENGEAAEEAAAASEGDETAEFVVPEEEMNAAEDAAAASEGDETAESAVPEEEMNAAENAAASEGDETAEFAVPEEEMNAAEDAAAASEGDETAVFVVPEEEMNTDEMVEINLDAAALTDSEDAEVRGDEAPDPAVPEDERTDAPEGTEANEPDEPGDQNEGEEKIRAFVRHCYSAALGREADEAGLNDYTHQIASGIKTPEQIAREFIFSTEFQNRQLSHSDVVRVLYRLFLYRDADEEGLSAWVEKLDAGVGLEEVVNGFAASDEFRAVLKE